MVRKTTRRRALPAVALVLAALVAQPAPPAQAQASVVVTAPKYESPGGTVPIIVTAYGLGRPSPEVLESLKGSATGGARVDCTGTTWQNPRQGSVSRKCYLTTPARAGWYTITGVVRVQGRTVSSPGRAFEAKGRPTWGMDMVTAQAIERCHNPTRDVWLTFDDGYVSRANLDRLLKILRDNNVRGRFFLVGSWARANPSLVSAITREGHVVHNHTLTHPSLNLVDDRQVRSEIRSGPASTQRPALMRPPYGAGALTPRVQWLAGQEGYQVCRWTTDTRDWEGPSPDLMRQRVEFGDATTAPATPGGVVLMHLNGPSSVSGLQAVIDGVRARRLTLERLR